MNNRDTATKLKEQLIRISPLIEEYTAKVCPECTDVCCKQKHGMYRDQDRNYLRGLGVSIPRRDATRPLEGPCEMMGPRGCSQPRWLRPFRCTWYFCEPLIKALHEGSQKKARILAADMQAMIDSYQTLSPHDADQTGCEPGKERD